MKNYEVNKGDYTWVLKALGGAALIVGAVYGIKKLCDRHVRNKVIVSEVSIMPSCMVFASGYYKGHSWAIGGSFVDHSIEFTGVITNYDYSNDESYVSDIQNAVMKRLAKK